MKQEKDTSRDGVGAGQTVSSKEASSEKRTGFGGLLPPLSPKGRFWLGFSIVAVFVCAVLVGLYCLKASMFERNPHFVVRRVCIGAPHGDGTVRLDTYWSPSNSAEMEAREKSICDLLKIDLNSTNTFSRNLGEMRRQILKDHPEIADLTIQREMPDTLRFTVVERLMMFSLEGVANGKRIPSCYVSDDYMVVGTQCVKPISVPWVMARGSDPDFDALTPGTNVRRNSFIKQAMSIVKLIASTYPKLGAKLIVYCPQENGIRCTLVLQGTEYCVLLPLRGDLDKFNRQLSKVERQLMEKFSLNNGFEYDARMDDQCIVRQTSK